MARTCEPVGAQDALAGRWALQLLVVVELLNAFDWATTVAGTAVLGLPERGSATAYLMHHIGLVAGATVIKAAAAFAFGALAAASAYMARRPYPGSAVAATGLLWSLAYASLVLGNTVLWNLINIWHAGPPR
jgi:hypothetical protein